MRAFWVGTDPTSSSQPGGDLVLSDLVVNQAVAGITVHQACGYLPRQTASLPFWPGQNQFTLTGDRHMGLLHSSAWLEVKPMTSRSQVPHCSHYIIHSTAYWHSL